MKIVKTRDAATAVLRKLGVNSRDYNLFIKKVEGGLEVNVELATAHTKSMAVENKFNAAEESVALKDLNPETHPIDAENVKSWEMKSQKKAKTKKAPKSKLLRPERVSVSSIAEGLIIAGKTNQEVWAVIKERFKLDDTKKSYPAWYRGRLRRKGIIKE